MVGAELGERHDQKVDRPGADGATARAWTPWRGQARQQGRDHPEARPHGGDKLVGSAGIDDRPGRQPDRLAGLRRLAWASPGDGVVDAEMAHDPQQGRDVGEARHVAKLKRLFRQEARDHQRQGRVLGPGNRDRTVERRAAPYANAIHQDPQCVL